MDGGIGIAPTVSAIEAEMRLPSATVQICRIQIAAQTESILREDDALRLDLSLTPRLSGSRFSFSDHWSANRFEAAGKVFALPPKETLKVRSGVGRQLALFCYLHTEPMRQWFETEIEWTDRRLEASLDVASPVIGSLLAQLAEEVRRPGFANAIMGEALTAQIAVQLHRYFIGFEVQRSTGGLAPWRLRLIDERLTDMATAPSLSELAGLCRLSTRQLSRGFRMSRGIPIGEYVAQRRLDTAKTLLLAGRSVKSVAGAMGFSSPSSFCYAFRKSVGMTPRYFREQIGVVKYAS